MTCNSLNKGFIYDIVIKSASLWMKWKSVVVYERWLANSRTCISNTINSGVCRVAFSARVEKFKFKIQWDLSLQKSKGAKTFRYMATRTSSELLKTHGQQIYRHGINQEKKYTLGVLYFDSKIFGNKRKKYEFVLNIYNEILRNFINKSRHSRLYLKYGTRAHFW